MVGMDDWAWERVRRWTDHRIQLPIGPLFCILAGPTRARGWSASAARGELRRLAAQAGVRRRFAPHQLRHAHAIEMAHEGIPLPIIQRQLGHAHLGITSIYLQGIDTREIVDTIHRRRPPVIPASAGLRRVESSGNAARDRRITGTRPAAQRRATTMRNSTTPTVRIQQPSTSLTVAEVAPPQQEETRRRAEVA